ncbi:helix-turn-helix transcriptional regulator [Nocardia sp. 2]|uniref:Helix-turn-helix transcriptional regulator n=1 Tax=Nocardia acididurans TaxID=2802282 RepID=A0ABS1MG47_9NOCA|nr:helix-turn-helix transcriptional regulator [Nocardia acididurans]MBL1079559.1 helix-turn-helix transcriptional regulator [Nocardia acididurans]
MSNVQQARETLGARLRELRKQAGLTGRALAELAGWQNSKVSRYEHGRQTPTEQDIRTWCELTNSAHEVTDLIASVRSVEAAWLEWKRIQSHNAQKKIARTEAESRWIRGYDPDLIPGLLQTRDYATAVLRECIEFIGSPDDLAAAVAVRMERQRVLRKGTRRFHFVIAEQALYTTVGSGNIMTGQLEYLATQVRSSRVGVGIVPRTAHFKAPATNFLMYDTSQVQVETVSAELTITQPREIALYEKAFHTLARQSVRGESAHALIQQAIHTRRSAH